MSQRYTTEHLQLFSLFEKIARVQVKDCFEFRGRNLFIIEEGRLQKALGKNKENLAKLEKLMKRKIKIVEFHPDLLQLVQNIIAPLRVSAIEEQEGIITIKGPDTKTKGLMIGARAQNLRALEEIVRVYHPGLQEIKVV